MFFFSSRRRHTRYIGDWSSDVCSSDLPAAPAAGRRDIPSERRKGRSGTPASAIRFGGARSEERRVGKECRCLCAREGQTNRTISSGGMHFLTTLPALALGRGAARATVL